MVKPLAEMNLSETLGEEIKHHTVQGGSNIIKLRGRSSFQSPAYNAVKMIEAAMGRRGSSLCQLVAMYATTSLASRTL